MRLVENMSTRLHRWLRSAASGRVAVPLLVAVLSVAGFIVVKRAVDADRQNTANRQAETDAQQVRALLERAGTFAVGLGNALQGERAPDARRFDALVGGATTTVGLSDAMWVERVSETGRRPYERRIRAPITQVPGGQPAPPASEYLPATFVTGLPFRRGADMKDVPALAAGLRNPAALFAGTATSEQTVAGQRGFFMKQGAQFGRGPGSKGFLVVFVPAGWLSASLGGALSHAAISLDGRPLDSGVGSTHGASQSFEALTHRWRVTVAQQPASPLQAALPGLALAWPLLTAVIVLLVGRGMVRRRRAEREVDDIFDLSLDLLCTVGADGYLKRVNPAFERTLGYRADVLTSRPLVEFVHPDDREATRALLARLWEGGQPEPFERRYMRADGAVRWLQWNIRPALEQKVLYAAAHDVTDTRLLLAEQAALRRVATLVAESRGAGELFQAVAVEVRELLGADATRLVRNEQDGTASVVAAHGASDLELGVRAGLGMDPSEAWRAVAQRVRDAPADRSGDEAGSLAASLPAFGIGAAYAAPVIVSGRPWGAIVAVWRRADLAPADTQSRMRQFTELVATAVANAASRDELADSRRRVVATADDARRRIERDLHDGAQQRLVHSILTLKLARERLLDGSEGAAELVERALAITESANDELRELARGIHPAILTKGGLEPALRIWRAAVRSPCRSSSSSTSGCLSASRSRSTSSPRRPSRTR